MKTLLLVFFCAAAMQLQAQSSATATVSVTIVNPVRITKSSDMDFGNIVIGNNPGSVILEPSGSRSTTSGVTLPSNAGTVSVASFKITGEVNYAYTITLPQTVMLSRQSGSETMRVDGFKSLPAITGLLDATGSQVLTVGATLHTNANQPVGLYTTLSPFEVLVNYN